MTNKQLQEYLKEFPDDLEVVMAIDGVRFAAISKPLESIFTPRGGEQTYKITLRQAINRQCSKKEKKGNIFKRVLNFFGIKSK